MKIHNGHTCHQAAGHCRHVRSGRILAPRLKRAVIAGSDGVSAVCGGRDERQNYTEPSGAGETAAGEGCEALDVSLSLLLPLSLLLSLSLSLSLSLLLPLSLSLSLLLPLSLPLSLLLPLSHSIHTLPTVLGSLLRCFCA